MNTADLPGGMNKEEASSLSLLLRYVVAFHQLPQAHVPSSPMLPPGVLEPRH
jgi:hypothetical protein